MFAVCPFTISKKVSGVVRLEASNDHFHKEASAISAVHGKIVPSLRTLITKREHKLHFTNHFSINCRESLPFTD